MPTSTSKILDDNFESQVDNKRWVIKIFLLSLSTSIYLFLVGYYEYALPKVLFELGSIEIQFYSLSILFILFLNSILIPFYLDCIKPTLSIFKVACYSGILFFGAIIFKVITYNYFIYGIGLNMNFGYIFFTSIILGLVVLCASNIRIRKLRGRKTIYAWLAFIVVWIALTMLSTM